MYLYNLRKFYEFIAPFPQEYTISSDSPIKIDGKEITCGLELKGNMDFAAKTLRDQNLESCDLDFQVLSLGKIAKVSNIRINGIPLEQISGYRKISFGFDKTIVEDLSAELIRARTKFPSGYNLNCAAMEELGECVSAQMQNLPKEKIRKEAIQVMAMCVRIIEETDRSIHIDEETSQK